MADDPAEVYIKVEGESLAESRRNSEQVGEKIDEVKSEEGSPGSPNWINMVGPIRASRIEDSKSSVDPDYFKDKNSPAKDTKSFSKETTLAESTNIHNRFKEIFKSIAKEETPLNLAETSKKVYDRKSSKQTNQRINGFKSASPQRLFPNSSQIYLHNRKDKFKGKLFKTTTENSSSVISGKANQKSHKTRNSNSKTFSGTFSREEPSVKSSGVSGLKYNFRKKGFMSSTQVPESVYRLTEKDKKSSEFVVMKPVYDKPKLFAHGVPDMTGKFNSPSSKQPSIVDKLRPFPPPKAQNSSKPSKNNKPMTMYQTLKVLDVKRPYSPPASRIKEITSPLNVPKPLLKIDQANDRAATLAKQKSKIERNGRQTDQYLVRYRFLSTDNERSPPLKASEALETSNTTLSKALESLKTKQRAEASSQERTMTEKLLSEYQDKQSQHFLKVNLNKRLHSSMTKKQSYLKKETHGKAKKPVDGEE